MEGPCVVCGKPSGPCKINQREKSFFCICLVDLFEDHVTIPCYIREKFNKLTSNIVSLTTNHWFDYTVQVGVTDVVTVLYGNKWGQFVADHGLAIGDTLMFTFPKMDDSIFMIHCRNHKSQLKPRLDQTVSHEVFNSNVDYKLQYVFYTKGISLSNDEKENLRNHIADTGFGAAGFFVHRLSKTNLEECLKFPESITSALRTDKIGQMLVYVMKPECKSEFDFRINTDGRMATTGSTLWRVFAGKANFKRNELISFTIFKESTRLVVSADKL